MSEAAVWVLNVGDDTASIVDIATQTVIGSPLGTGNGPEAIVFTPETATYAYIANASDGTVQVIDTATGGTVATVTMPGTSPNPEALAISPDGSTLYAADVNNNVVWTFDTTTNAFGTSLAVGNEPDWLSITPDGTQLYCANYGDGTVSAIDTGIFSVTATILCGSGSGSGTQSVTVSPDGSYVYVSNWNDDTLSIIDTGTNTITGSPITVGTNPIIGSFLPDGSYFYVPNNGDGTVSVVDTGSSTVVATVTVGGGSSFPVMAVATNDAVLVSINASGEIVVIDPATNTVPGPAITVGTSPAAMALGPLLGAYADMWVPINSTSAIEFIDIASGSVVGTPITVDSAGFIAVSPDGSLVYNPTFFGVVQVIDPSTSAVVAIITPPGSSPDPSNVVFSPDGTLAYVLDYSNQQVDVIDVATSTPTGTTVAVGNQPYWVDITPDGTKLYVPNFADGTVSVIDTTSMSVIATVTIPATAGTASPATTVVSPDGSYVYVLDENASDNYIVIIDTATDTVVGSPIVVGSDPNIGTFTPDGSKFYCANYGAGTVSVIDTASSTVTATVTVGTQPVTAAVSPDGTKAYVPLSGSNQVVVIDTSSDSVAGSITVASQPFYAVPGPATGSAPITVDLEVETFVLAGDPGPSGYEAILVSGEIDVAVTTFVLAGPPGAMGFSSFLIPTPPNPQPGPFGNHEYEVVVCDKYGVAYGVIPSAVPTQIDYVLDDIGQALIDFAILDEQAAYLLPMSVIPGVREIQIWRDQVLIFWGWPTSATWDASQVHLTCSNLLWPFGQREIGPEVIHYVHNPQFEEGLYGWTPSSSIATAEAVTNPVVLGKQAARLICNEAGADSFLGQDVVIDLSGGGAGQALALSAYVYVDGNYNPDGAGPTFNALDNRGLYMEDEHGNFSFVELDDTIPKNTWTRLEVQPTGEGSPAFIAPGGEITTYQLRLYCPNGSVVWDDVNLSVYENVSSPPSSPPATAWDVWDIIKILVETAQQAYWGKSDLAIIPNGSPTGVMLNRVYYTQDSEVYLDALNEFPTLGIIDYEIAWDETGHFRYFRGYYPAKGSIKYNYPVDVADPTTTTDLEGAVDGTQVGTTQRIFGQGSSGPARDAGYASFASYLGGRVFGANFVVGSNIVHAPSADFTDADIGVNLYSLAGALYPSTYITDIISSSQAHFTNEALFSINNDVAGVGGLVLDASQSALPNQPVSTLGGSAMSYLIQQMKAQALPAPKIRADGPNGLFGLIEVGDVIPVSADYGWLQMDPQLMRVAKISLYPPTEEMQPTFMPVNALPSLS